MAGWRTPFPRKRRAAALIIAAVVLVSLDAVSATAVASTLSLTAEKARTWPGYPIKIDPAWNVSPSDLLSDQGFGYFLHTDFGSWQSELKRGSYPTEQGFPRGGSWAGANYFHFGDFVVPPVPAGMDLTQDFVVKRPGTATITGYIVQTRYHRRVAAATTRVTFAYPRVHFGIVLEGESLYRPEALGPTYVRSTARGSGEAAVDWKGKSPAKVLVSRGSARIAHIYLHGSDRITLAIGGERRGGKYIADPSGRSLFLPVRVAGSDDPDCPRGRLGKLDVHDMNSGRDVVYLVLCGVTLNFVNNPETKTIVAVKTTVKT